MDSRVFREKGIFHGTILRVDQICTICRSYDGRYYYGSGVAFLSTKDG